MRRITPFLALLTASLFYVLPCSAQQAAEDDKQALPKKYDELIKSTISKGPLIDDIFANSKICGGSMGASAIAAAEAKAERQTQQQNQGLVKSKKILDNADAQIKAAVDAKLSGKLTAVTSGVDICKGEIASIKQLTENARSQSKQASTEKIDSLASEMTKNINELYKEVGNQIQTNRNDRSGDLGKLNMALSMSFTAAPKQACTKVIGYVERADADKMMEKYRGELQGLIKKTAEWKETKKIEMNAFIDVKVDKVQSMMLAGKDCTEMKTAETDKKDQAKPSGVSNAKPSEAPKAAQTAAVPTAKSPSISGDSKPEAVAQAPEKNVPSKPSTEASPALSPPSGKNAATDTAQKFLSPSASEGMIGPVYTPNPPSASAGNSTAAIPAYGDDAGARTIDPAPATATSTAMPAVGDDAGPRTIAQNQPYNDYGVGNRFTASAPSTTAGNGVSAANTNEVTGGTGNTSSNNSASSFPANAAPVSNIGGVGIQQNNGLYESNLDKYQAPVPSSAVAANDVSGSVGPGNTTPAATSSKDLKNSYQSNEIFTKRDLDFNSKKDTTMIQNALNQVQSSDGRTPASQITADGVMGSRSTARLDQVMNDPVQKAAFLRALKLQMSK